MAGGSCHGSRRFRERSREIVLTRHHRLRRRCRRPINVWRAALVASRAVIATAAPDVDAKRGARLLFDAELYVRRARGAGRARGARVGRRRVRGVPHAPLRLVQDVERKLGRLDHDDRGRRAAGRSPAHGARRAGGGAAAVPRARGRVPALPGVGRPAAVRLGRLRALPRDPAGGGRAVPRRGAAAREQSAARPGRAPSRARSTRRRPRCCAMQPAPRASRSRCTGATTARASRRRADTPSCAGSTRRRPPSCSTRRSPSSTATASTRTSSSRPTTASTPPSGRCSRRASRSSAAAPSRSGESASSARRCGTRMPSTCRVRTVLRPRARGAPAVERAIEAQTGLWTPIVLHWGWESDAGWRELEALCERIAPFAAEWTEFRAAVERSR